MAMYCGCPNDYQDRAYGKGMRAVTPVNKSNIGECRCTACGKSIFPKGGAAVKKATGKK